MEDFGFDVSGILSDDEATKLFEQLDNNQLEVTPDGENNEEQKQEEVKNAEEVQESAKPEGVGVEEGNTDTAIEQGGGSSPNAFSSIAKALKNDGIIPDFEDSEIDKIKTADDLAEFFEKVVDARVDERTRRVDEAMRNGVEPNAIQRYEETIKQLDEISEDDLKDEGEDGEKLRRMLMYNELINRGYEEEKAKKEIEKSFRSNTDLEDAKDALEFLRKFYKDGYKKVQDDARKRAEDAKAAQKKQSEDFRKMVLDSEVKLGDTVLSDTVKKRVYDAVSKPVYKDKETGRLLTAVQKFQKDNPMEFLKQLGIWYVLTDGGKNMANFAKEQVIAEKNKNIKELSQKINTTLLNTDGTLNYAGHSSSSGVDPLLSDEWKIG